MSSSYNPRLGHDAIPNESDQQQLGRSNYTTSRNTSCSQPSKQPQRPSRPSSVSPYYPSTLSSQRGPGQPQEMPVSRNNQYPPSYNNQNASVYAPTHQHPQYPPTGSYPPNSGALPPRPVQPTSYQQQFVPPQQQQQLPPRPVQNQSQYQPTHDPQQQQPSIPPEGQFSPYNQAVTTNPSAFPGQQQPYMSHFQLNGRRKALLVGINYRGTKNELRGCVRDVSFVHHLLTSKFGFQSSDIIVLTDEPDGISGVRRGAPTRRTILSSLNWLVSNTGPGDSLWFSFSGHGAPQRDRNGDEADGQDEVIIPVDSRKEGNIVDDELYAIVKRVPRGARLTVLFDCCNSGTALDLPYMHDVFGTGSGQTLNGSGRPSITHGLMDVAGALLNGNPSGALSAGMKLATGRKKRPQTAPDPNAGEVLQFSGCKDNQLSSEKKSLSSGAKLLSSGAMTYALIETLEQPTVGDWRNYTYGKLLQTMRQKLRANRMTQTPQFSTLHPFDLGTTFVI